MKNVRIDQLRTVIVISNEEFETIIKKTLGNDVNVEISLDGICISTDEDDIYWEETYAALAKYFDVTEVTSVHADDCDYPIGIWVVYKN